MMLVIPDRKILVLIIAIVTIYPIHYMLLTSIHKPEYVFNGYCGDDCVLINIMKSWEWGLNIPWMTHVDVGILGVIGIGPLYLLLALGVFSTYLGINAIVLFEIFKIMSSFLLFIAAYNLFMEISRKDGIKMFLVFSLAAGVGGLLHVVMELNSSGFFFDPTV